MNIKRSFKKFLHLTPLFVFLVILQGCSSEIQSNPGYRELNPLIGDSETEILGYFLGKSILHYGVTRILPEQYREAWLGISIVPIIGAVHNNHMIGVDMKF